MRTTIFKFFLIFSLSSLGCGGGSSGTGIGGGSTTFSGIVISPDGKSLPSTIVRIINTDDVTVTDDAGAFELQTDITSGDVTFELMSSDGSTAVVTATDIPQSQSTIDLSVLFDTKSNYAELLELTIRAKIVRSCSPFFLNSRTIRQISHIKEGLECTVEVIFKSLGFPNDDMVFELQHRGCKDSDPWTLTGIGKTGTSGPGTGEINFNFKNDGNHCSYRVIGPTNLSNSTPLTAEIHTLRKEEYDNNN